MIAASSTLSALPHEVAMRFALRFFLCSVCGILTVLPLPSPCLAQAPAQPQANYPSAETVADLLSREPMTLQNWPTWRQRLLDWIGDRSEATTPAFLAAWDFMKAQANPQVELPAPLAADALAWYLLGSAYLQEATTPTADPARGLTQ